MTLKTLFAIPITVILVVTMSLAGTMASHGWSGLVRGRAAVEAVNHMRLLLRLQKDMRGERVTSNIALARPWPPTELVKQSLANARHETDRGIVAIGKRLRAQAQTHPGQMPTDRYLTAVISRLGETRISIDDLLARGESARSFTSVEDVMPRMLAVAQLLDEPLQQASLAVTAADGGLSGLVTEDRLAEALRDQVALVAALLLPRYNMGGQPNDAELERLRTLLAEATYLTGLLGDTIELAGATEPVRQALAEVNAIDVASIPRQLRDQTEADAAATLEDTALPPMQRVLVPWGVRIETLRTAIVDAAVARVNGRSAARERQFDISLAALGVVFFAALESVALLSQRVVNPLAQLGAAITRIAAGDRSVALHLHSATREISEMVTSVETLRQAALVADATALRQRMAARHRLEMLRQALGIVQSVQESSHALERGVAQLSEGIDATIALVTAATDAPPPTLGTAADAVRVGLAEMRQSSAELDATFAAACTAQTEDRPEAEFVAHIRAVQALVDRRSAAVRGFVQPSLVALRDAATATGDAAAPALRDLVSDQFTHIEETVAVIAAMLSAVTRAAAIVRDLPLDDTPMAA